MSTAYDVITSMTKVNGTEEAELLLKAYARNDPERPEPKSDGPSKGDVLSLVDKNLTTDYGATHPPVSQQETPKGIDGA